ncbi:unnamed protein product [Mytilus coruscus]|uniref:Uncharacterized protein n=1 Tax=Mytilus coruscus TaxID=42192 RepID=A0A6J8C1B2_MYTCO|nr:unnamed protein product [Mytilus coruscus]
MEYGCESMKLWKVVYRLFHGKTLRFMSGSKLVGQIIDGSSSKGLYDPQTTKINFAVPNINSINNFDLVETNIPREMYPGVIAQALKFMPRDKNYVLSVDGKKLVPGLTNTHGDQDLFGHEKGNSLQDLKDRLESEIQEVETVKHDWNKMNDTDKKDKVIKVDQYSQANWISIKDTEDLPESLLSDTRYVKQRSQECFEKRKQLRLTGSKLFERLGLDSLKNLQKHYDKVIRKKNLEETFPNEVQEKWTMERNQRFTRLRL